MATETIWQRQAAEICRRAPNPVRITDATGASSCGPREDGDDLLADANGTHALDTQNANVTIPTHHLPALAIGQTVTIIDAAGVSGRFVVRDIRKIDDGLLRRVYLVDA